MDSRGGIGVSNAGLKRHEGARCDGETFEPGKILIRNYLTDIVYFVIMKNLTNNQVINAVFENFGFLLSRVIMLSS